MMVGLWNEFLVTKSPGQFRCWSPKNGSLEAFLYNHLANFEGFPWKKQQNPLEESDTTRATRVNWQGDFFTPLSSFATRAPGGCPCHPCVWAASVQPPASATMRANSAFMWLELTCGGFGARNGRTNNCLAWGRGDKKVQYIHESVCDMVIFCLHILIHVMWIYRFAHIALTEREEA